MEKIWLKSYPEGVPSEIAIGESDTLVTLMAGAFDKFADRPAFACMGRTITFGELNLLSEAFGAWLQAQGLQPGTRIAIMLPNVLQYPIAMCGALRAGLVVVNVNPLYTARELKHQLTDSGAEAMVVLSNFANVLEKVVAETQVKTVVVTDLGDGLGFPKSFMVNSVVRHVKKLVPPYRLAGHTRFGDAMSQGRRAKLQDVVLDSDSVAFLQYTGGTTGPSKGAMLTHGNIYSNILQNVAWVNEYVVTGHEIVITALPLYHIFGLVCNCLTFFLIGGLNVLITNPRDMPGFVKEIKKWPFTAIYGVNTLFNALLQEPTFAAVDFSQLKTAAGGGMAVQSAVAEKWKSVTGHVLQEGYGLTECSPVVSMNPREQADDYTGSCGLPLPSTEISIRGDSGQELPFGERGELCIRGPQVMKGYWQQPEATAESFHDDGFLLTGDIATIDESGYIRIVDRAKDMVLVSGFNVYPCEIEDVVTRCDGIIEAACIGVPDEKSNEAVKIFVVREPGSEISKDELIAYCRENLTGYKIPRHVEFRDELPKSNVGKILRRELRES
jgi:long-chain acyl-CoA synthetase